MTDGTSEEPWRLSTPSRDTDFQAWFDVIDNAPVVAVRVGDGLIAYDRECVDDLRDMLLARGDWVELGEGEEHEVPAPGTVEAWARSQDNPRGGWYGLTDGRRGRFAAFIPPVLEHLGIAEVEHNERDNRMRAIVPTPGVSAAIAGLGEAPQSIGT